MKKIDRHPKASKALPLITLTSVAATLLAPPAASAADMAPDVAADSAAESGEGVQTVIVTANRRAENLQSVPTSVSAVTAEELKNLGITSTTSIANYVPGVQLMTVNANTDNFFSIRGATQNDYAEHEESPVAVYMDGVYLSQAAGTAALLFDTERVEVLRGPQGTLFGRNATAGLVQYISKAPTNHPDGYVETSYGNFNANHTELAFGNGIAPGLSFRISLANDYMDPYLKNALYPDKGGGNSNSRAARLQLAWTPGDSFDATLNLHGVILNDRAGLYKFMNVYPDPNNHLLSVFVPPDLNPWGSCDGCDILGYRTPSSYDYYTSAADIVGYNKEHMLGGTLTLHGHFAGLNLTSISDFTQYYKDYNEDSESTPQDLTQFWTAVNTKQYSQELHLDNGGDGRLRWVAGAYYLKMNGKYDEGSGQGDAYFAFLPFGPYPGSDQRYTIDTKSWSEFAQAEIDLVQHLTLTVGGRWSTEKKTFDYNLYGQTAGFKGSPYASPDPIFQINPGLSGDAARIDRSDWSGKLALNYQITQNIMPYVSWNKGLKAGGFSAAFNPYLPISLFKFDEEKLYAYEAGIKIEAFDRHLRLNADAFKYSYVGYQAFNQIGLYNYITNNPGKMRGGEIELTVVPLQGLTLRTGLAFLDAWIEHLALPDGTIKDIRPAQAPETNITTSINYDWKAWFGGAMQLGVDYSYRTVLYYSLLNDPASRQGGYGLLNLRAEYTTPSGHWSFRLHGENVTGKQYLNNSIVSGVSGFGQGSPGMPATYGIRISYHL
jgi:iron complex outermembrane receptor protein